MKGVSKIYKGYPGGRRCIGRLRKTWLENTEEEVKERWGLELGDEPRIENNGL